MALISFIDFLSRNTSNHLVQITTSGRFFNEVMDSFSGRFPLDFISFYLDMSSEEFTEKNPGLTVGNQPEESASRSQGETMPQQVNESQAETVRKEQEKSGGDETGQSSFEPTPSPSTDESISAYIERTLQTLGSQRTGLGLTILPPDTTAATESEQHPEIEKASQPDPIVHTVTEPPKELEGEVETDGQANLISETGFSITKPDYFQTDTSDIEELLDSSGAETVKDPPNMIPLYRASATCSKVSHKQRQNKQKYQPCRTQSLSAQVDHCLHQQVPLFVNILLILPQHPADGTCNRCFQCKPG